jgi:NAD(P)-dependent dehydrogenase (short-subunit alcohol dehydrogenase family)
MTRTILITGTSSGYGKAACKLFLSRGWNVLAGMRTPDAGAFGGENERLKILPLDITKPASIEAAIEQGIGTFGAIDVLVNNAGIGLASAFEATPDAIIRDIFETNSFGTFAMCRAVIPHMRQRRRGVIINVTSSAGIAPMPLVAVYTASKTAVEGFTESLSYELHPFGIQARLVEPGYAPTTNFTANGLPRMEGLIPTEYEAFAGAYFARMAHYPTAFCTEVEVAEALFAAATESGRKLRYPAGADTRMLSELRWSNADDDYMARMRAMFDPAQDLRD